MTVSANRRNFSSSKHSIQIFMKRSIQTEAAGRATAAFRDSTAVQLLVGVLLLAMVYYTRAYAGRAIIWAGRVLCALVLWLQVVIVHRGSQSGTTLALRSKPRNGVAFRFLGLMERYGLAGK